MVNSRGSSLQKFPHDFPAEIQGKWRRTSFFCGYFRLLPLWNPWGYFHVEISLLLPSSVSKQIQWHRKGPSYVKISKWWFDVILWWIKMFTSLGNLLSHLNTDLKIPLTFRVDSSFTPKFQHGFPPPTTTCPRNSSQNQRDFDGWGLNPPLM